ncbi:carbohydrate-binding protein [Crepidotus variabilis]|uniref:Carbohydrate-binding protein n=1 Tax=Crepidotus variabilis TaxID=179855 RepID=A0A9P6BCP8_9AGAR|nr:carbohydrate-binding protein [Crepidotus variabilis]
MTSWGNNRLDIFVRGMDSSVGHRAWDGTSWSADWDTIGGESLYDPISIAWGPERLDVFIVNYQHELLHKHWSGTWSEWENFGGTWVERPSVVSWGPDRLDVFVIGKDRKLYNKSWDGHVWSGFNSLGGQFLHPVSAVSWGPNRIDIFGTSTTHTIDHKWWDGTKGKWGPSGMDASWDHLGGTFYGQPKAVSWGPNRLDVFAIGTGSALFTRTWKTQWSGSWLSLGGTCYGVPEVISWGPGRMDVFVLSTSHSLAHKWYADGTWGPSEKDFEAMSGTIIRQVTGVCQAPNRIDLFVIGYDSGCSIKTWDEGWKPDVTGYTSLGGICFSNVASKG